MLSRATYTFSAIPIKNTKDIHHTKRKLSKNSHGSQKKKKKSQTPEATLSNGGSITVSDYRLYYWAIITRKDINQWSRKLT